MHKFFNKIYANGCSFTCAGGLNFKHIRDKYTELLNIKLDDDYIQYAYPNIVGKELQFNVVNEAIPGLSLIHI
jgi:hypothetical protein